MKLFTQPFEYQAGGQTVSLEPDEAFIGVRLEQLDAGPRRKLEKEAHVVSPGLAVVRSDHLPQAEMEALHGIGALFPVFTGGGAQIVALPEVRVEPPAGKTAAAGLAKLEKWLGDKADTVEVLSRSAGRIVLKPLSQSGPDAVKLAGDIARKFKSLNASPRLLRVMPRTK